VLKYLAAYMAGGPISDRRLISDDDGVVTFWARSKDKAGGNLVLPWVIAIGNQCPIYRANLDDPHEDVQTVPTLVETGNPYQVTEWKSPAPCGVQPRCGWRTANTAVAIQRLERRGLIRSNRWLLSR
jgi:hypothetical protein